MFSMSRGKRAHATTSKFFLLDINNRDKPLNAIRYTVEDYIHKRNVGKICPFLLISAFLCEYNLSKVTKKNQQ